MLTDHLLAQPNDRAAGRPLGPINEKILDIGSNRPTAAHECLTRNLCWLLEYLGYQKPEYLIGSEWSFNYSGYDSTIGTTISGMTSSPYLGLRRFGFTIDSVVEMDPDRAWTALQATIDRELPVIIWVDAYVLPYRRLLRQESANRAYTIVVYGYTDDLLAWVIDGTVYKGPVQLADLKAARSSPNPWNQVNPWFSGQPINNRQLIIASPQYLTPIKSVFMNYVDNMLAKANDNPPTGYKYSGPQAIARLADDLTTISNFDPELFWEILDMMHLQLSRLVEQRSLGAALLTRVSTESWGTPWIAPARSAKSIHRTWSIIRSMMIKTSLKRELSGIRNISNRLYEVASMEAQLLRAAKLCLKTQQIGH